MQKLRLLALLPILLTGCYVDDHADSSVGGAGGYSGTRPTTLDPAESSTIDADAWMDSISPGNDLGIYVEYAKDGTWHVYTTCDVNISNEICHWEVYATPLGGAVFGGKPELLEPTDSFGWDASGVSMTTETTTDVDGFYFTAKPGVAHRFEVYLDGENANRWLYWVGDEAVHSGAPSDPMDLVPGSK